MNHLISLKIKDESFILLGDFNVIPEDIDANEGTIDVDLSEDELESRKKQWIKPKTDYNSGTLWKYSNQVGPARYGAVTHPGAKEETHCYADI